MGTIQEARNVIASAEASLRELIQQGLKEQRYAEIAEVAALADGIARLRQIPLHVFEEVPETAVIGGSATSRRPKAARSKRSRPKADYPRFERDGDKLVKVGWSKKNRDSYEHRASREVVVAFARHLSGNVPEGKAFAVEDLIPVPDVTNGGEIPAYQIYLTLAWLRHAGAVEKKGRDGYLLRRGALTDPALDRLWAHLPARAV
jgi:hypothetical protein